jgi:hypothetical protein
MTKKRTFKKDTYGSLIIMSIFHGTRLSPRFTKANSNLTVWSLNSENFKEHFKHSPGILEEHLMDTSITYKVHLKYTPSNPILSSKTIHKPLKKFPTLK